MSRLHQELRAAIDAAPKIRCRDLRRVSAGGISNAIIEAWDREGQPFLVWIALGPAGDWALLTAPDQVPEGFMLLDDKPVPLVDDYRQLEHWISLRLPSCTVWIR